MILPTGPRLILLQAAVTVLRGRHVFSTPPAWPAKDPAATLDLGADFRVLTGGQPLDGCTATAAGCTLLDSATFGSVAAVQVAGGTDRTLATVTLTAAWGGVSRVVQVRLPVQAGPQPYDGPTYPFPGVGGGTTPAPTPAPSSTVQGAFAGIAGAVLSGHRALMANGAGGLVHADPADPTYAFAGISAGSAMVGAAVQAVVFGLVVEPSWNWTPLLPLFAGPDGVLTQTVPLAGVVQQVGVASSATSILVQAYPILVRH